jgi:succinate-semialdehyde dehydrogenase/glutarate-semialdehyde dehydrogenase
MVNLRHEACLIAGEWRTSAEWIDVRNPADDALIGRVPRMGSVETNEAIAAAGAALPGWSALAAAERADCLLRFHELMLRHTPELARILTAEQGKPLAEAAGEIRYAASFVRWFGEEARRAYGEVIPSPHARQRIVVLRQPIGVVAAITPWNFPAAMVTRKLAPALAAGCTMVLKPAELTPFTAIALGALVLEAGIPPGVFNIVTGDPQTIGAALTASATVRKLTFTGSTRVGAKLYEQCAPTIKNLSLELGGNAPFIVFDDADLDEAVKGAIASKFRNAGQTCVCADRFFVQSGIHDRFLQRLSAEVKKLKTGRGDDASVDIGPLINDRAVAKVNELVSDALARGAVCSAGEAGRLDSRFVQPMVLSGVRPGMRVLDEEVFGPVAAVVRFDTEAEVIAMANASPYGLASYVFTNDNRRVWRVAEALEAGMVGINTGLISNEVSPFGGVKHSGIGREGSRHGLDEYLEFKTVTMTV